MVENVDWVGGTFQSAPLVDGRLASRSGTISLSHRSANSTATTMRNHLRDKARLFCRRTWMVHERVPCDAIWRPSLSL